MGMVIRLGLTSRQGQNFKASAFAEERDAASWRRVSRTCHKLGRLENHEVRASLGVRQQVLVGLVDAAELQDGLKKKPYALPISPHIDFGAWSCSSSFTLSGCHRLANLR